MGKIWIAVLELVDLVTMGEEIITKMPPNPEDGSGDFRETSPVM